MKRQFLITLILVVLVGCVAPNNDDETKAGVAVPGVQVGQIAPDFTVPTLDNGSFTLSEHAGKPAIIFFMAYWCGTCLPEARALTQLQQEYGDQLVVIALDVDPSSSPEALNQFKMAADNGAYVWAFDTDQQVAAAYEVQALDTTLVLDGNGRILYRDAAPTPYQTLKEALAEVLP
ncbi:MAG: TlpA family protein disulfide reductase [Anaerolineae bacterium]